METIVFASYRGGVGKSTLLAECAHNLASEAKVYVIDADITSPFLETAFLGVGATSGILSEGYGFLRYLKTYEQQGEAPLCLSHYFTYVVFWDGTPSCKMMPAGSISHDYVRTLLTLDQQKLFPHERGMEPGALNLLLNLRNRVKDEFEADYLLVDTPAGINELGLTWSWFVADKLVWLTHKHEEGSTELLLNALWKKPNGAKKIEIPSEWSFREKKNKMLMELRAD